MTLIKLVVVLIACSRLPWYSHNSAFHIDTQIGKIEFIEVASGEVRIGRDIGISESVLRIGEPKRLNESPSRLIVVSEDYYLMRNKITVECYVRFLNGIGDLTVASHYVTPAVSKQIRLDGGVYIAVSGKENEHATCISFAGAVALANFLSESTSYSFSLPSEAELMLASVGPVNTDSLTYSFDKSVIFLDYPLSIWESGFLAFLSPVGEWTSDKNEQGKVLLKRCVNSLYEREFLSPGMKESGQVFGVRLLAKKKSPASSQNKR